MPCSNAIDMAILLDASRSMKKSKFAQLQQFVLALAKNIDLSGEARLGLITFNREATLRLAFDDSSNQNLEYVNKTLSEVSLRGNTRIYLALQKANKKLFNTAGNEDNKANVLLLLTGGKSHPRVDDYKSFLEPLKV